MNYIEKATQHLTINEYIEFEDQFSKKSKKTYIAYVWWAIFGAFGGHRFYLGYYGTGLIILVVTVFTLGLGAIAGFLDVMNIKRLTEDANKDVVLQIIKDVKRR